MNQEVLNKKGSLVGDTVDGYEVLELKGEGGFSQVYKVSPKGLEQRVFALKFVPDQRHFALLEEETRMLAQLDHPQIPSPLRTGEYGGGRFLVMDYVPTNLAELVEKNKGQLTHKNALDIMQQVLRVLQYAHSKGVVHKDLKPRNIGLNDNGNVTLLDFNIAKQLKGVAQERGLEHSQLDDIVTVGDVQKSVLGGTEGYKSPEQRKLKVDGKVHEVNQKSDIYTLGVMLYEMITGHIPDGKFKPASSVKGVPKWIDNVVDKALAQNPNERYQNAQEMLADIQKGLNKGFDVVKENKFWKWISETAVPFTMDGLAAVTEYSWKAVKFPFWVYGFGLPQYFHKKNGYGESIWSDYSTSNSAIASFFLTLGLWIATIAGTPAYLSGKADERFLQDFKKDPRGTIVAYNSGKFVYFSARDATNEKVPFNEVMFNVQNISNFVYDSNQLFFTGTEKTRRVEKEIYIEGWFVKGPAKTREIVREELNHGIYAINLANNQGTKVFDLDKTIEGLFTETLEDGTTITDFNDEKRQKILEQYGLADTDRTILDLSLAEGERLVFRLENNWYSANMQGTDFRKENIIFAQTNTRNLKVCPHGTHRLDIGNKGVVQLEWKGGDFTWGSYNTPVQARPIAWLDYKQQ